jgi:hypothetical protein
MHVVCLPCCCAMTLAHVGELHVLCIAMPSLVLLSVPALFPQVPDALLLPLPGRASHLTLHVHCQVGCMRGLPCV